MGLGNPGPEYQNTRHNAGFWFVERWAGLRALPFRKAWFRPYVFGDLRVGDDRLVLVKPLTFMNNSGLVVASVLARFGATADDLLVVFDQMDLPPGRLRLKPHGSHGGHNGLRSIEAALGNDQYHRLAVGVGRPAPGTSVIDHVLGAPSESDAALFDEALGRAVPTADAEWPRGWEPLLNALNQPAPDQRDRRRP
jgi:PTH1 family peptidyl-tRNA hydrolase